jgi:hypothetical protein
MVMYKFLAMEIGKQSPGMGTVSMSLAAGIAYLVHLAMDLTTPKGLPLV